MTFLDKGSFLLAAGDQDVMFKIDVDKGSIVEEIPTQHRYSMMRFCRYVCAATNSGAVNILNPQTLELMRTWQAHTSNISDMDAKTDFLVTCGWATRPYGHPIQADTMAKVFDLKSMKQLPPISFQAGAAFVQIHPKMSTTSVIGSRNGQLQIVDIMNPNTSNLYYLSAHIESFIMSPSGNIWAMADRDNVLHIWGSQNNLQFNEVTLATEFADPPDSVPYMNVDDDR